MSTIHRLGSGTEGGDRRHAECLGATHRDTAIVEWATVHDHRRGCSGTVLEDASGGSFPPRRAGCLRAATSVETHRMRVRAALCALPADTIVTGVTGLQLLGIDVGSELPMRFATTHPRQIRRRDVKVMRLQQLPAHRDRIAAAEQCWLIAAAALNLLDLVTGRLAAAAAPYHPRPPADSGPGLLRPRRRAGASSGQAGAGTSRFTARDLAASLLGPRWAADA